MSKTQRIDSIFVGKKVKLGCYSFEGTLDGEITGVHEELDVFFYKISNGKKDIYFSSGEIAWIEIIPESKLQKMQ